MPRLIAGLTLIAALALAGCRAAPIYSPSDIAFATPPTSVEKPELQCGAQRKHPNYNTWITNLQNDIQAEITRMKAS
jgi:hypothetical protein